jgi:hypothetical protein
MADDWEGANPRPAGGVPDDQTLAQMDTFGLVQLATENGATFKDGDDNATLIKALQKVRT